MQELKPFLHCFISDLLSCNSVETILKSCCFAEHKTSDQILFYTNSQKKQGFKLASKKNCRAFSFSSVIKD